MTSDEHDADQPLNSEAQRQRIGKHLAIDLGDKRTGLAVCDAYGMFASPLKTLHIEDRDELAAAIIRECEEQETETIVIGLPLHMSGEDSHRAILSRQFGKKLEALGAPPIVFEDERLSSWEASAKLVHLGVTGKKRKAKLDAAAAQIFLEAYLNKLRPRESMVDVPPDDVQLPPVQRGFERPRKRKRR